MGYPFSGVPNQIYGEFASSGWNPTEAQREILEQLFKEGHWNPTRTRINEITNILKHHGDVEPEDVFYWFQNAEARKNQKQENNLVQPYSLNGIIETEPVLSLRMTHFSPQHGHAESASSTATQTAVTIWGVEYNTNFSNYTSNSADYEILELFPLHPDGCGCSKSWEPQI